MTIKEFLCILAIMGALAVGLECGYRIGINAQMEDVQAEHSQDRADIRPFCQQENGKWRCSWSADV